MEPPTEESIAQSARIAFQPQEFDEIIRIIYRFLSSAIIRGKVDTVTITTTHLIWSGNGKELTRLEQFRFYQKLSFGDVFRMVLARDTYIQNFVHLVSATPTEEVYYIGIEPPTVVSEAEEV